MIPFIRLRHEYGTARLSAIDYDAGKAEITAEALGVYGIHGDAELEHERGSHVMHVETIEMTPNGCRVRLFDPNGAMENVARTLGLAGAGAAD